MEKNKVLFEAVDENGSTVKLCVKKPNEKQKRMAQLVYAKAFKEALAGGAIIRAKLSDYLIEQGLRSDDKVKKQIELMIAVSEGEKKLEDESLSKEDKEKIALKLKTDRQELLNVRMPEINLDNNTAEAFAQNEQFNYLVSCCTYTEEGVPVFKSLDDYSDKSEYDFAIKSAQKFSTIYYGLDEDFEANLPENKFLNSLAEKEVKAEPAISE